MRPTETKKRFANASKIRTIDFARSGIGGTGTLTPRARRTLAVYVVLVKMGFDAVAAPMGAIADAVHRSSHGEARSIRTLQRSNLELQERGFISCANYRPGVHSKGAVIWLNTDAFTFWTRQPSENISPLPTQAHNVVSRETLCDDSLHTTSCHPSDRTRDNSSLNSQYSSKNINTKQRASARANYKKSTRPRKNAVLYTVGIVLSGMTLHRADRRAARDRAECELKAIGAGVELVNPSGVDWDYWGKRWNELGIPVRETTAAREIVPRLLGHRIPDCLPQAPELPAEDLDDLSAEQLSPPTADEIRSVREHLEAKFSIPAPKQTAPEPAAYPEIDLSDPGMKVLFEARERARARVDCG